MVKGRNYFSAPIGNPMEVSMEYTVSVMKADRGIIDIY